MATLWARCKKGRIELPKHVLSLPDTLSNADLQSGTTTVDTDLVVFSPQVLWNREQVKDETVLALPKHGKARGNYTLW